MDRDPVSQLRIRQFSALAAPVNRRALPPPICFEYCVGSVSQFSMIVCVMSPPARSAPPAPTVHREFTHLVMTQFDTVPPLEVTTTPPADGLPCIRSHPLLTVRFEIR